MRFTLRQLSVFLETARTGKISHAAERLSLSQSAASNALKELERQYGILLFDRVGKRLVLNDLGRAIRPRAEALLDQAEDLEQDLLQQTDLGELKVGATLTIGNYLAVGILTQYRSEHPHARIGLEVANTSQIVDKVANFELDIGMIEGEVNHPDLELIPWQNDELVIICAPDHPWAGRPWLTDEDLVRARWILRESGSGTRQAFDRAMHGLLAQFEPPLELQHTEAIKRAVEAGLGLGCLSRLTLQEAFARGSLVPLPVPQRPMDRQFYLVLHRNKFRSRAIEQWINLC
ncbi:LysR family transcriptional regulator [Natronospirillum operosum]|uniref:LysR family transcriptional regulator n=1 Tax=Natronospirillum operosum TaxID=2759953 RepID=A0A4Z0WE32_9GAMM|nr:LysR family transcriptional regulator [Natronospirillum operosum]TGG96104.1 LysR family transcriptional regulator [Natronospirillum operosum]